MGSYFSGAPTPQHPPAPANAAFHRNTLRPDWIITGKPSPDVWGDAFHQFMGLDENNRPLVLGEGMQVHSLVQPEGEWRCRYCKHIAHGDQCAECGAPR